MCLKISGQLLAMLACVPEFYTATSAIKPATPAAKPANSGRVPTGVPLLGCRSAGVCATDGTASQAESSHCHTKSLMLVLKLCIVSLFPRLLLFLIH